MDVLTCRQVLERLQDYLDRELDERETARVAEHLEAALWCAAEARFEASVLREVRGRLCRIAAPPALLRRVSAAISAALEEP